MNHISRPKKICFTHIKLLSKIYKFQNKANTMCKVREKILAIFTLEYSYLFWMLFTCNRFLPVAYRLHVCNSLLVAYFFRMFNLIHLFIAVFLWSISFFHLNYGYTYRVFGRFVLLLNGSEPKNIIIIKQSHEKKIIVTIINNYGNKVKEYRIFDNPDNN